MKIVILGAGGYIGTAFLERFPDAATPKIDIADPQAVHAMLDAHKPDVVINAAGKTGRPNVDWCEDHKAETLHANVLGPMVLREACAERGIYWVHLSSGCMYAGDNEGRGFSEDDEPNFHGSYYSRTKVWSEAVLRELASEGAGILIIRPRMPFDGTLQPRNLLTKLANYSTILDEPNSITFVPDMINAAAQLIEQRAKGIYNVVNPGVISPYAIMERYRDIVDPSHTFGRYAARELDGVVKAPRSNCFLRTDKLAAAGITLQPVEKAIDAALASIRQKKTGSVAS